ncbi:putative receptor protein kinase ZmPK1 [Gastrolobium bilobum]|uniref:putative receptor protein kinase ZmPK1 n=1 Tax=Gastrolobium bilobum TaxID=150636 RepID=UPI002AB030BE|nr:putative receptor protein kinase ZmPK1 [Gastrolobium bilobum]
MLSPNGMFSAGFYAVGDNAYSFAIWFSESNGQTQNATVVWMANRDQAVNGMRSKLSLLDKGNLALTDADGSLVWSTNTVSLSPVHLSLNDVGNLVLRVGEGVILWQSFDFPTDTLVPQQVFTRYAKLVSSRSETNKSSGFYSLFFDSDNILRLLYDGPEASGLYWPDPWLLAWQANRAGYNNSRVAAMDSLGNFSSSDDFTFMTSDYGTVMQRRVTVDYDGNIRAYSRRHGGHKWTITWQAKSRPCRIHGICGPNSLCSYSTNSGIKCTCLPGYKMKNDGDWAYGCVPKFSLSCNKTESSFLVISNVELYGYDYGIMANYTLDQCKELCLQLCGCKGIQYSNELNALGTYTCYPKLQLQNAYRTPYYRAYLYLKLPANSSYSHDESIDEYSLSCSPNSKVTQLERAYDKGHGNRYVKFMVWFAAGVGGLEILCIFLVWYFLGRTRQQYFGSDARVYDLALTGFRKFSYSELKHATKGFSEEIGRGGGGTVYKGVLWDERVAAIKRLKEANQGEEDFLAEVSIIGRLNHMNLIEMWGYCADGKHRLLVYEYLEHGSLAENIKSNRLDWTKRFDIALGTAKGLAYIHEECLEWILHCDVKPHNILLDSNYHPKVADFGLSKLRSRNDTKYSSFSRIRGTRGYMAPEWVFNQPITSKVDVYSYGIVILEMITGMSATMDIYATSGVQKQHLSLVAWLREKQNNGSSWVDEILDRTIRGGYEESKMEALARVALQCVEEERDKRPTMSQVVEMLQKCSREDDN